MGSGAGSGRGPDRLVLRTDRASDTGGLLRTWVAERNGTEERTAAG